MNSLLKIFQVKWIVSRWYDLFFFIGSVTFSVLIYMVHLFLAYRLEIPLEAKTGLFTFIIFGGIFDFPHILQMFSRTHKDKIEHARHRNKIVYGLIGFLVIGELSVLFNFSTLLLSVAALFGIWHGLRQNLGFLKMYKALNDDRLVIDNRIDSGMFYLLVGAGVLLYPLNMICFIGFVLLLLCFIWRAVRRVIKGQGINVPKLLFMGTILSLYYILFFILKVPILVFIAMDTIYHDVQYQGWIRFYQKRRFKEDPQFANRWFVKTLLIGVALGISPLIAAQYAQLAIPSIGALIDFEQKFFMYVTIPIYMLIFYHYYIEGVIWRIGQSPEIKEFIFK